MTVLPSLMGAGDDLREPERDRSTPDCGRHPAGGRGLAVVVGGQGTVAPADIKGGNDDGRKTSSEFTLVACGWPETAA